MSMSIPSQKSQESVFRLARPIELDEHNHATSSFGVLEPDERCGFVNTVVKDQAGTTGKGLGIVQRPACGAAYTSGSGSGSATSARRYSVNTPRAHNSAYKAKSKSRLELQSPNPGCGDANAHEGSLYASSCYNAAGTTTPGACAPEDIENQPHFVVTRPGPENAASASVTGTGTDATLGKPLTELNLNLNLHLNLPYPYPHPHHYAHSHSHPPGAACKDERSVYSPSGELQQQQQQQHSGAGAGAHTPQAGHGIRGLEGGGLFSRHASPAIGTACCYPLTSSSSPSIQVHHCAPGPVRTEGGGLNLKHIEPQCVFCEYENANADLGLKAASETKRSMKLEVDDRAELEVLGLDDPMGTKDSQSATPTSTSNPENCDDNDNEEDKQLSAATIAYSRTLFLRPTYAPLLRNSEHVWPSTQEAITVRPSALIRRDFV
ncbi:hypothetical protein D9613_008706 [Agrocybe pediades]|uniref:Uncharacterized protein n=1 Tax=Agrocybe pediades TaxID=84607 RepID=A0A8H4VR19_9AGAR|nr:hypothetical protein D9613_008706 [Agrocybe pediades]